MVTELISRLQRETSSETSKSTEKKDLEADTGKLSSKFEEILTLQLELLMDTMRADEGQIFAKAKADPQERSLLLGKQITRLLCEVLCRISDPTPSLMV